MSLNNPVLGEGYVPAYQISAVPYITASSVTLGQVKSYDFPCVTKSLTVQNLSGAGNQLAISFTENGLKTVNSNFFIVGPGATFNQDVRTSKIFISGSLGTANYQIYAGLTNIPVKNFLTVTGSNGYSGVG
jgi:hypothetical protein